jgi:hypothetical protein
MQGAARWVRGLVAAALVTGAASSAGCAADTGAEEPEGESAEAVGVARARHVVLYYMPIVEKAAPCDKRSQRAPLSYETARRLIAYVDTNGKATGWMFDGILFVSLDFYHDPKCPEPSQTDLVNYKKNLFASDVGLGALERAVRDVRAELGDPSHTVKVYFEAPYLPALAGGASAVPGVDALRGAWAQHRHPGLELAGFYWGYEESGWQATHAETRPPPITCTRTASR